MGPTLTKRDFGRIRDGRLHSTLRVSSLQNVPRSAVLTHTLILLIIVHCHNCLHEHSNSSKHEVTLFLLRCRPVGGPGSREPFGVPVNLGTWEPDIIGILSSYGAKAVSEVISRLRCKISLI